MKILFCYLLIGTILYYVVIKLLKRIDIDKTIKLMNLPMEEEEYLKNVLYGNQIELAVVAILLWPLVIYKIITHE